jgi:hypothetical protein
LDQFKELMAAKHHLELAKLQPSAAVVENILNHARGLQEKH